MLGDVRARFIPDKVKFDYDFFIKDHLGNVRSVIAHEAKGLRELRATHEIASANTESMIFGGLQNRAPRPMATAQNQQAVGLDGSSPETSIGTSVMLKVMAGDKFDARVDAFYDLAGADPEGDGHSGQEISDALLNLLSGGISDLGNEAGGVDLIQQMIGGSDFVNIYHGIKQNSTNPGKPKERTCIPFFCKKTEYVIEYIGDWFILVKCDM